MPQCIGPSGSPAPCQPALSTTALTQLAQQAGLSGDAVLKAVATALAESGGVPNAVNYNTNGTKDVGLWQINDVHTLDLASRLDPLGNAKWASSISNGGTNWTPWCTWVPCVCGTCTGSANTQYSSLSSGSGGSSNSGGCSWLDRLNPTSPCNPLGKLAPNYTPGGLPGEIFSGGIANPFDAFNNLKNAIDCAIHPVDCAKATAEGWVAAILPWIIILGVGFIALIAFSHEIGADKVVVNAGKAAGKAGATAAVAA